MREAKKRCRIICRKFRNLDFLIDDEKYFGSSGFQMSGNRGYYTSDFAQTPMTIKKKFEPKVMLWIAMSPKGYPSPHVRAQHVFHCAIIRCQLLGAPTWSPSAMEATYFGRTRLAHIMQGSPHPFLTAITWITWRKTKEDNPTEVPQRRPVEDFFGLLATRVYHRNWVTKDVPALKRRIRKCISAIPPATVQATMESVRKRLLRAWMVGVLEVCHWLNMFKIIYFNPCIFDFTNFE